MSNNHILLSICIPTYNRADYLKESLRVLLPQVQPLKGAVEVLVSDNCSTDNTQLVVEQAVKDYNIDISYSRNEENIGGNNNMVRVVARSNGEYVYIMGDDDYLSPDFMTILFRILRNDKEYSLLYFNRLSGDENCSNCVLKDSLFAEMKKEMAPAVFISEIMSNANFISSIVFNRHCWDYGANHLKETEYFGYNWFARIYWGAVDFDRDCVYYYMPLIIQRNGLKTWKKFWPQYLISSMSNIFYDLDKHVPGVYGKWMKKLKGNTSNVIPSIASYRTYYRNETIKELMFRHLSTWDRFKYQFYLIPGTQYIYMVYYKIQHIFK